MRIALLADIHANHYALRAVLAHISEQSMDTLWFLGDIVGYGPHAVECVQFLRERVPANAWVIGNHDAGLVGRVLLKDFNPDAQEALAKNRTVLEKHSEVLTWCEEAFFQAPARREPLLADGIAYVIVHGTQEDSIGQHSASYLWPWARLLIEGEFVRLYKGKVAGEATRICVCYGHAHVPSLLAAEEPFDNGAFISHCITYGQPLSLGARLTLLNPGSVGQPRDGDPRAAYAILDTGEATVTFHRVPYDYRDTQWDMQQQDYPSRLRQRLKTADLPRGPDRPNKKWRARLKARCEQGSDCDVE